MRIDPAITPYKLASDVAEMIKTLRITPHGVTKFHLLKHTWAENQILLCQIWQHLVYLPTLTGKKNKTRMFRSEKPHEATSAS